MKTYFFYILLCCIVSLFLANHAISQHLPYKVNNAIELNEGNTTPNFNITDLEAYETTTKKQKRKNGFCNIIEIEDKDFLNSTFLTEEEIQRIKDWAKTVKECCKVMNLVVRPAKNIRLIRKYSKKRECKEYNAKLLKKKNDGEETNYGNTLFIKESHDKVLSKRLEGNYTFYDVPLIIDVLINNEFSSKSEVDVKLKKLVDTILFKANIIFNQVFMTQGISHAIVQSLVAATVCTTECATHHMVDALNISNYREEHDYNNYDEGYDSIKIDLKQVNLKQLFNSAYEEKAFEIFIQFETKQKSQTDLQ